jgi:hypothetical protein
MSKLYAIIDGLISVVESESQPGLVKLLFVKTYPDDLDSMGVPFPDHRPRASFSSGGVPQEIELANGEDVKFTNGHQPAAPNVVTDLARLPSFSDILAKQVKNPQDAFVKPGCAATGGVCPRNSQDAKPRIAARLLLDQGTVRSIQVDEHSDPLNPPIKPVPWRFFSAVDLKTPVLKMACDNALLLEMDLGQGEASLQIGTGKPLPLDKATAAERAKLAPLGIDPAADCVIVHLNDMVDPNAMKKMHMNLQEDSHFVVFFDLLNNYNGPKVTPNLDPAAVAKGQGFPLISRCIPPRMKQA